MKKRKLDQKMKSNHDRKKLLVTASTFPRWEGDSEPRFILDLCETLKDYFDVTVLVPAAVGAKDREVMNGVKVIRYHYFPIHKMETLCYPGAIVPRIREKKSRLLLVPFLVLALWYNLCKISSNYDVIHSHWIMPQGIIQSLFKKPYLLTGHGTDVSSLNIVGIKSLKRRAIKNAKYVTVVSEALASIVESIYPPPNLAIIPMGCKTNNFGQKYRIQNFFGQGEKKVILFVGRLTEIKGVQYLIRAMEYIDAKLVIVGTGLLEEKLKNDANRFGDKVEFLGGKSHDELKTIYASADIFVAPSITDKDGAKEGFGLVILEAMASGLPVVASRSGGIVDIIRDGENGLLTEEKNPLDIALKINSLLDNEKYLNDLKNASTKTAQQFDYSVVGRKYAEILSNI